MDVVLRRCRRGLPAEDVKSGSTVPISEASMSRRVKLFLFLLLFTLLACAQTPTAEITGAVIDATGGVIAAATVTITNVATNAQRVVTTNSAGVYDAPALAPGIYSVRLS